MISSFCVHQFLCLNYRPGISVRNSQNLQMRYAQMQGLDWMISVFARSEQARLDLRCGEDLDVNHSTVLRRLAG
jgi:hypothetical protein